jgi:hypothetical protein
MKGRKFPAAPAGGGEGVFKRQGAAVFQNPGGGECYRKAGTGHGLGVEVKEPYPGRDKAPAPAFDDDANPGVFSQGKDTVYFPDGTEPVGEEQKQYGVKDDENQQYGT